jgi:hypothetical protein
LFHEEGKEEEVVGVVVGMEYLVSLADVGMQDFLFFRTRSRWVSGILPGYSCKEGRRRTPIRIPL